MKAGTWAGPSPNPSLEGEGDYCGYAAEGANGSSLRAVGAHDLTQLPDEAAFQELT